MSFEIVEQIVLLTSKSGATPPETTDINVKVVGQVHYRP